MLLASSANQTGHLEGCHDDGGQRLSRPAAVHGQTRETGEGGRRESEGEEEKREEKERTEASERLICSRHSVDSRKIRTPARRLFAVRNYSREIRDPVSCIFR